MSGDVDLAGAVLQEYGDVTRGALVHYLPPREPHRHLYGPAREYPRRGGRMLRPSICIATARVFGAATDDALRTAVAIELLHNAFLVHDDVEDESEARRGHPTLNAAHGAAIAVNVGDGLALTALRALLDNRPRLGPRVTLRLAEDAERATRESIEGQAIELGWRRDNATHVTEADYLEMVLKKTCWYTTIFPSRAGAIIATRGEADVERFVRFGFFLGAAFQIQDDLLNLIGDERRYGKELGGDLWEGKRTLMLLRLLEDLDAGGRARLIGFLSHDRRQRTRDDVAWILDRMHSLGCIDHGRRVAHALAGAARHEGELLYADRPDSRDRRFLMTLPEWVLARR
jgi:geranylgeranyl diphosphate synthase type II